MARNIDLVMQRGEGLEHMDERAGIRTYSSYMGLGLQQHRLQSTSYSELSRGSS